MSVAFTSLKVGDIIYDCHRHRLGNTTATELGIWSVRVVEIDLKERKAFVSWNGNNPQWKSERYFETTTIKRNPPEWTHRLGSGMICHLCGAKKTDGHRPSCTHPKAKQAVSKRKESKCSDQL